MPHESRRNSEPKKKGPSQEDEPGWAQPEQGANDSPERDDCSKTPSSHIKSPPQDTRGAPDGDERGVPIGPLPPGEPAPPGGRDWSPDIEPSETPLGRQLESSRKLAHGMLRQAAADFWSYRADRVETNGVSREFYLVKQYILVTDYDYELSFCNCCDLLGVDPPYLRRRIFGGPPLKLKANLSPAEVVDALDAAFEALMKQVLDDDGSDDDGSDEGGAPAVADRDADEDDSPPED